MTEAQTFSLGELLFGFVMSFVCGWITHAAMIASKKLEEENYVN